MNGTVKAGQLLIHGNGLNRPIQVTVKKLGIVFTIPGIIIVESKIPKITSRPGNLIRAKA